MIAAKIQEPKTTPKENVGTTAALCIHMQVWVGRLQNVKKINKNAIPWTTKAIITDIIIPSEVQSETDKWSSHQAGI